MQHSEGIPTAVLLPPMARGLRETKVQMTRARHVISRAQASAGHITVWYGAPGMGKTGSAGLLCRRAYADGDLRAAFIDASPPNEDASPNVRQAIRAMMAAASWPMSERAVRFKSANELCRQFLALLLAAEARILVIDEAGRLGEAGLEAVAMLSDVAAAQGEKFHIVLVGMDNLRNMLKASPRVVSRTVTMERVGPLTPAPFRDVILHVAPWVREACEQGEKLDDVVTRLYELSGGCLRDAITLLLLTAEQVRDAQIALTPDVLVVTERHRRAGTEGLMAPRRPSPTKEVGPVERVPKNVQRGRARRAEYAI